MKGPKSLDEIHRDDGWFTLSHKQLNNEIGKGGSYCHKSSSIIKGSTLRLKSLEDGRLRLSQKQLNNERFKAYLKFTWVKGGSVAHTVSK